MFSFVHQTAFWCIAEKSQKTRVYATRLLLRSNRWGPSWAVTDMEAIPPRALCVLHHGHALDSPIAPHGTRLSSVCVRACVKTNRRHFRAVRTVAEKTRVHFRRYHPLTSWPRARILCGHASPLSPPA
jgi:hypothetical protein